MTLGATPPEAIRFCPRCQRSRCVGWRERLAVEADPQGERVLDLMCPCGEVIERRVKLSA